MARHVTAAAVANSFSVPNTSDVVQITDISESALVCIASYIVN